MPSNIGAQDDSLTCLISSTVGGALDTQAFLLTCQAGQESVQMRSKMISNALRPAGVCKDLRGIDTTEEAKQGWDVGTPHCPKLHSRLKVLWSDGNWCLANKVHNLVLGLHERQ